MSFFREVFEALNAAAVRYVVVGGVAVNLHGYSRFTVDVDLVVDLERSQAERAVEAMESIGLKPSVPVKAADFADPVKRASWIAEKNMLVFQMLDPLDSFRRLDLFVEHPMEFEGMYKRAEKVETPEGTSMMIASIEDLIAMKRVAGRHRDFDDIEALEEILEERRRHGE